MRASRLRNVRVLLRDRGLGGDVQQNLVRIEPFRPEVEMLNVNSATRDPHAAVSLTKLERALRVGTAS